MLDKVNNGGIFYCWCYRTLHWHIFLLCIFIFFSWTPPIPNSETWRLIILNFTNILSTRLFWRNRRAISIAAASWLWSHKIFNVAHNENNLKVSLWNFECLQTMRRHKYKTGGRYSKSYMFGDFFYSLYFSLLPI
jgi:hypothetical protein